MRSVSLTLSQSIRMRRMDYFQNQKLAQIEVKGKIFMKNGNLTGFMSIKDTATHSGFSQFYIRKQCKSGTVPCRMAGTKYMIDYEAFMEREHRLAAQAVLKPYVM